MYPSAANDQSGPVAMMWQRSAFMVGKWIAFGCVVAVFVSWWCAAADAQRQYQDRLVWVFGWNLRQDQDVAQLEQLLKTAAAHGINGAVLSAGLDTLCKKPPEYFDRLARVRAICDRLDIELIPAAYGVGYGSGYLAHNPNLAEGLPVRDALFVAGQGEASLVPEGKATINNGGFEQHNGDRFSDYNFHDQPGAISFADTAVRHSGQTALRMENFASDPHGHGRVMQEIAVTPHRCYRVGLWIKTEALTPVSAFKIQVLAGKRTLAPQSFRLAATGDWRKLTLVFNSLDFEKVRLYAGVWGGRSGKFWLDDWSIEEIGPLNILHRPGTPVVVLPEGGAEPLIEGRDYAPLVDTHYSPYRVDRPAPALKLLPGTRIKPGQRLRLSWYHSQAINGSQVTVCMAEPELYQIMDREVALLAKHLHPRRVLLNMDEIRMGGTCAACSGRDMGELLGECITRQVQILRQHIPGVQVYVWSDMVDPNHNAHGDYYLVDGDYSGSWNHVPKDLTITVWGGPPREKSLRFFADHGFKTMIACYYDADDLTHVRSWLQLANQTPNVRGFMYTPWQKKYALLGPFGDLISQSSRKGAKGQRHKEERKVRETRQGAHQTVRPHTKPRVR